MPHLTIRLRGRDLPGRDPSCGAWKNVHVGVQVGRDVPVLVPGDAAEAVFDVPVEVVPRPDDGLDFRGKAVHGPRGERFIYLSWGEVDGDGGFAMFRRAKLRFDTIPAEELRRALEEGLVLEGQLPLRDKRDEPLCSTVRPPVLRWQAVAT
jgi:hypothetical protein